MKYYNVGMTDPLTFPMTLQDWLPWLFIVILGAWGGAVIYFRRLRHQKDHSSPALELIGDLTTSGFVATIVGILMRHFGIDWSICFSFAGMSGHLGARTLFVGERLFLRRVGLTEEEIAQIVEPPSTLPFGPSKLKSGLKPEDNHDVL